MGTYGPGAIEKVGRIVQVSADGYPEMKAGGVTIDWDTIAAVGADTELSDGTVVKAGDKYIRYGTIVAKITASGKYGPSKTDAVDGRQTLTRGECFIVNETVLKSSLGSDHPAVFEGGKAWLARLLTNENAAGASNPTLANVLAAFPRLLLVRE